MPKLEAPPADRETGASRVESPHCALFAATLSGPSLTTEADVATRAGGLRGRGGAISSTNATRRWPRLLLTILDGGGVHLEKFGDSNGRILEPLSIS